MNKKSGGLYIFIAATLFSLGGVCAKFNTWSGISMNGARCLLALIPIGLYLIITKHRLRFNIKNILGGLCLFITTLFCMTANKTTTAANAIILQYIAPIYIILYRRIFKKQRSGLTDILTCVFVLVGLVVFLSDSLSAGRMFGNIMAALSGLTYAAFCILGGDGDTDNMTMILVGFSTGAIAGIPFLLGETDFSLISVGTTVILGFLQMGLAYILFGIGLERTGAVATSLISTVEPILNPILVALLYKETMGITAIIGAVIVISAILVYNVIKGKKKQAVRQ